MRTAPAGPQSRRKPESVVDHGPSEGPWVRLELRPGLSRTYLVGRETQDTGHAVHVVRDREFRDGNLRRAQRGDTT